MGIKVAVEEAVEEDDKAEEGSQGDHEAVKPRVMNTSSIHMALEEINSP